MLLLWVVGRGCLYEGGMCVELFDTRRRPCAVMQVDRQDTEVFLLFTRWRDVVLFKLTGGGGKDG